MRFGGHESFAVRDGWLARGLELLSTAPALLDDEFAEDHLGVGRNMAKSIRHWLTACGLAELRIEAGPTLAPSRLGTLIYRKDPHFLDVGTWWMLHANLVTTPDHSFTWNWFFNHWSIQRFDRAPCLEALKRFAAARLPRSPAQRTLERDVATMLQSYARLVPARSDDPEDSADSPFQDLGLLLHHAASGYFQLNFDPKPITRSVFGYVIASMPRSQGRSELTIAEVERSESGPGRCFLLKGDDIYDLIAKFEGEDRQAFALRSLAGERGVRFESARRPLDWAKEHYALTEVASHA